MNKLTVPDTVDVRFMCMKGVHSTTCSDIPDKSSFIAALKHNEYLNWWQSSALIWPLLYNLTPLLISYSKTCSGKKPTHGNVLVRSYSSLDKYIRQKQMWFFPLRVQGQHCKVNNIIIRFNLHKTKHSDNSNCYNNILKRVGTIIFVPYH